MRSVDVAKCWPFASSEMKSGEVEKLLPPITVAKFKWWSHELKLAHEQQRTKEEEEEREISRRRGELEEGGAERSSSAAAVEEKSDKVCPVCRVFSAATVNAVNAHIDECLARTSKEEWRQMKKAKSKAPKKRSITEIFAVAPQIDTIEEDFSDGSDRKEEDEENGSSGGDELADDFKVLSVSTSSTTASPTMKNNKNKKKSKKRKKEKKRVCEEEKKININSNKKLSKKKMKKKKKNSNGGSVTKKVRNLYHKLSINSCKFNRKFVEISCTVAL